MKVEPDQTPDTYKSMQAIMTFDDDNVKVMRNVTKDENVYFNVVDQPDTSEISCPSDIETVASFKVTDDEAEGIVESEAIRYAGNYGLEQ